MSIIFNILFFYNNFFVLMYNEFSIEGGVIHIEYKRISI